MLGKLRRFLTGEAEVVFDEDDDLMKASGQAHAMADFLIKSVALLRSKIHTCTVVL